MELFLLFLDQIQDIIPYGLKLNTQKTKIMESGPIISWQINGEAMETMTDFIFGGSKITADSDCSHEIRDTYSLGEKL